MKILLVEDEIKLANSIKRGLSQQGYVVDIANDSDTAEIMMEATKYDLLILDRMLPGKLDGIGLVKKAKQNNKNQPIMMLTAKTAVLDRAFGLNSGADDYLDKPFAFVELIARVRALLRRPSIAHKDEIVFDDLVVDTTQKIVKRNGKNIVLTAREYTLLEHLVRNNGQIFSKETLINQLWDSDADVLPNTVEVYMGYLRNKIDKPFKKSKQLINTKRGFGYYLGDIS